MPNTNQTYQGNLNTKVFLSIAVLLVIVTTILVYIPGLSGGFMFDDTANITNNPPLLIDDVDWRHLRQAAGSSDSGRLGRPVSMISFSLNYYFSGLDPYWFKVTNLVIHLVNGIVIFFLSRFLLMVSWKLPPDSLHKAGWAALIISAAWLLHPLNLTSVLYIVQRMTQLAAFFSILGMTFYVWGRWRQIHGRRGVVLVLIAILVCAPLAALSKENGLLVFPFLFLIEWVFFRFKCSTMTGRYALYIVFVLTVVVPVLFVLVSLFLHPQWLLSGYEVRDFDLQQRLYTESRILWFYGRLILIPDITRMGLFHDDIAISTSLFDPATTWIAILGLCAVTITGFLLRWSYPILAFGILFFLLGHVMESTVIPLELAHEHRNYLPDFGLLFAVFGMLLQPTKADKERLFGMRSLAAVSIVVVLAVSTAVRAKTWGNSVDLALTNVRHHPGSARSNIDAGGIFVALGSAQPLRSSEYYEKARYYFESAARPDGPNLLGEMSLLILDDREGRPVDIKRLTGLARRLAEPPLAASTINALLSLSRCQHEKVCHFPAMVFDTLYPAILSNPGLTPGNRSQLLTERVQYAVDAGDLRTAAGAAEQAVKANPTDPQLYLNYAQVLLGLGDTEAAARQLELAGQNDNTGFYSEKIKRQKRVLAEIP